MGQKRLLRLGMVLSFALLGLALVLVVMRGERAGVAAAMPPGDPLPRIACTSNYTATLYAEGLSGPDGLALTTDGRLYVAEETSGEISQIGASGLITPLISGLNKPEGLTLDNSGNLYIVEDANGGRLLQRQPNGTLITLTTGLVGAENVA